MAAPQAYHAHLIHVRAHWCFYATGYLSFEHNGSVASRKPRPVCPWQVQQRQPCMHAQDRTIPSGSSI